MRPQISIKMIWRIIFAGSFIGMAFTQQVNAASLDCSVLSSPIYQIVNPTAQTNLLTPWQSEASSASQYGFTQSNGTPFYASLTAGNGLIAAHRLYNSTTNDFIWIVNQNEIASAVQNYGYTDQGINFYVPTSGSSCTQPVYRFLKGNAHRFAVSQADQATLTASGWKSEGIMFYGGIPPSNTISASTPMPTGNLPGWTLVYADDFNGPLNTNAWGVYTAPGSSNVGTNWWTASHVVVSNGMLQILGYVDKKVQPDGRVVTGGLGLWTLADKTGQVGQKYGKWEMLVRMDACQDVKYAWMLWPVNNVWPAGGEVDFAEDFGGNRATTNAFFHYASANGQDTFTQNSISPVPNFSSWHIIGVEWTAASVRYTLDGQYWGQPQTAHLPPGPMVFVVQTEGLAQPGQVTLGNGQCNAQIGWVVQYKPS